MESSILHTIRQEIMSQKKKKNIISKFQNMLCKETMESILPEILKSKLDRDDKTGLGTAHSALGDKGRSGFFCSLSYFFRITAC